MRRLLDNSTRRRLELLELLNDTNDWVKSNDLAQQLDASLRTINNDIQFIKEYWSENMIIETSKQSGVRLSTPTTSHIQLIYTEIIQQADGFKLLQNLFLDPTKNLEDWENEIFVSYSSLYRISQALSDVFKPYHITLKNNPLHVVSTNEVDVRYFFANYFNEVYFIREWIFPFPKDQLTIIAINLLETFYQTHHEKLDNMQIVYLTYILATSLMRYKQGFYTSHTGNYFSKEQLDALRTPELEMIAKENQLRYGEHLILDLAQSIFLFKYKNIQPTDWSQLTNKIDKCLRTIESLLELSLTPENRAILQDTFQLLYLDHLNFPHNEAVLFNRYSHNAKSILTSYPGYSKCLAYSLKILEQETSFPWYSEYYMYLVHWVMIKWQKLPRLIDAKKVKARVLVLSDHGEDHAAFVKDLLETHFETEATITAYKGRTLYPEKLPLSLFDDYDICISNMYLEQLPSNKALFVHTYPNDEEWAKIRHVINKNHQLPKKFLEKLNDINQQLKN